MTEAVLEGHERYHHFSYWNEAAVLASTLLLVRHRVSYITFTVSVVVQGILAGYAPVEVRRLKDDDFIRPKAWRHYSRDRVQRGRLYMKCCLAGALMVAPVSLGLSVLPLTIGIHLWGDVRFYGAIKRRMAKVRKLHVLKKAESVVNEDDLKDPKHRIHKIIAKTITQKALKALESHKRLRKLTVDTFKKDQTLLYHPTLKTVVLNDQQEGWERALIDNSSIERIVIKGEHVTTEQVQAILDGKHQRLRVIELENSANMHEIHGDSYVYVPPKKGKRAKIRILGR